MGHPVPFKSPSVQQQLDLTIAKLLHGQHLAVFELLQSAAAVDLLLNGARQVVQ